MCLSQSPGTRQCQCLWHQFNQQNCSWDRRERSNRLHACREPIICMPDIPNLQEVGGAAGEDKHGKTDEHPVELEIFSLANKIDQRDRNRIIGQNYQRVRNGMEANQTLGPKVTMAVRHEWARIEKIAPESFNTHNNRWVVLRY